MLSLRMDCRFICYPQTLNLYLGGSKSNCRCFFGRISLSFLFGFA